MGALLYNGVMESIALIGMPGSGKSTVGRALARALDMSFVDADKEMLVRTGASIATVFEIEGEVGFRQREATLIRELLCRKDTVLATGGGAILDESTRAALREHTLVIYLRATLDALWERTRRDSARPLLRTADPRSTLADMLGERDPLYAATAHIAFDSGRQSASRLAAQIAASVVSARHYRPGSL